MRFYRHLVNLRRFTHSWTQGNRDAIIIEIAGTGETQSFRAARPQEEPDEDGNNCVISTKRVPPVALLKQLHSSSQKLRALMRVGVLDSRKTEL